MWIIGQKIFSDKNILPIKTANIFGKQYFTNKHVLAGDLGSHLVSLSLQRRESPARKSARYNICALKFISVVYHRISFLGQIRQRWLLRRVRKVIHLSKKLPVVLGKMLLPPFLRVLVVLISLTIPKQTLHNHYRKTPRQTVKAAGLLLDVKPIGIRVT